LGSNAAAPLSAMTTPQPPNQQPHQPKKNQLWQKFKPGVEPPAALGASRDYNVDMVPKFMMANGKLVKTLIYTDVTKYLEFKAVDGSYVLNKGKVYKTPVTPNEALTSPLMGMFEKLRARSFFVYVEAYEEKDPATHKGLDLRAMTMAQLYQYYGLDAQTVDFIGHAIALHR
jgi:Rab GDP dissociation inhibitor